MCTSRPATPEVVPVQQAPTQQDPVVSNAATTEARKQRAQSGAQSTILTTDTTAPLLGKTLLGA